MTKFSTEYAKSQNALVSNMCNGNHVFSPAVLERVQHAIVTTIDGLASIRRFYGVSVRHGCDGEQVRDLSRDLFFDHCTFLGAEAEADAFLSAEDYADCDVTIEQTDADYCQTISYRIRKPVCPEALQSSISEEISKHMSGFVQVTDSDGLLYWTHFEDAVAQMDGILLDQLMVEYSRLGFSVPSDWELQQLLVDEYGKLETAVRGEIEWLDDIEDLGE